MSDIFPSVLRIGDREIGPGHPAFVIAEAGVNHNGDMDLALRLVDAAAEAGADAVKFQTFCAARLVSAAAPTAEYQAAAIGEEGFQLALLEKLELSTDAHRTLIARAQEKGILFLSTPFDAECADLLQTLALPAFKVSSGDLTNHAFLAHLARTGLPVLLSTGMSYLAEVREAVQAIRAAGGRQLALLHCASDYPAQPADVNLRAMETLRGLQAGPVGFSDHTLGIHIAASAVALGATIIEKHLTLDRSLPGPDHLASLEPAEFAAMMRTLRDVESALGDGEKRPRGGELDHLVIGRKSLHWRRDLAAGAVATREDFVALRPATGFSPARLEEFPGRVLAQPVRAGSLVEPADFAP
jgi:N-acetylneuraminate synthase/N,N'-diacetyllegionaminate synthase